MKVLLDAIQFCHDPMSAAHNALSLQWDATRKVIQPEWRRGACVGPEDSPAAYAISESCGHTITIKARFRKMVPGLDTVEVRAVDPTFQHCGWLTALLQQVGLDRRPSTSPLGEVSPRCVTFDSDGLSDLETFELADTKFEELGVGAWTTIWQWQYQQSDGSWIDFDRSEHRIFVLLETPKEPWTQQDPPPLGLSLARVDALEYACRWAQGSRTRTEVAAGVTRGVFRAGPDLLRYDRIIGGSAYFGYLTLFLERLRGGEGNGVYVNCNDCANAVTSLANILGCELWSSQLWDQDPETFETKPIAINPMILIGESEWGFPFPGETFVMHQVAIDGEGGADDRVFDACLMVDGDDDPTKVSLPRTPLLPEGLRFAQPKGLAYRERFAAPEGRGCIPLQEYRARFSIMERNVTRSEPRQIPAIRQLARLAEWSGTRSPGADILFLPFDITGSEIPGWQVIRTDRAFEGGGVPHIHCLMGPEHGGSDSRLRVEAWQLPSRTQAHEYLAELLGRLEGGPPPRLESPPVGDVAFADSNRYFLAFARGNLVVWLRNAGLQLLPVEDAAMTLDRWLIQRPKTPPDPGSAALMVPAAEAALAAPIGFKYFAEQGELSIQDGRPVLRGAPTAGTRVMRVALNPSSRHVAEMLDLGAE